MSWWNFGRKRVKPEVHVPRYWGFSDLVREFNAVWVVPAKYKELADEERFRKIVARIWEADRDGMEKADIDVALEAQEPDDVIENGLRS